MNAYYFYYYFLQIDTNYLYDNRNNRLIEINYLLAIIRFVFKYKEETEKAYLIQLPANVVCLFFAREQWKERSLTFQRWD